MKLTHLLPTLLTLLTATPQTTTAQETSTAPSCGRRNTPRYCQNTNYTTSLLQTYLCGDSRLGPTHLPSRVDDLPVAPVLATALYGYDRFGGLCPGDFVKEWFDNEAGWWRYPPEDGFAVADPEGGPQAGRPGRAISGNVTLREETLLDRFGSEYGAFVSPAGAPYGQRALPPSNLVGDASFPYNYHVYSVVKPLVVLAGPIAPWFGQAGAGVQYKLYQNVATLISEGFLRREDPSVLIP